MTKIKNKKLENYWKFQLNKETITKDDFKKVQELQLDYDELIEEENFFNIKSIDIFPNLTKLTLTNFSIDISDFLTILELQELKELVLNQCIFENADIISTLEVESLSLVNCIIINYNFLYSMTNLKELTLINGTISLQNLNYMKDLEYLELSASNVEDPSTPLQLEQLKEIYLDHTNIEDLSILRNCNNLIKISISEKQYHHNEKIIPLFQEKNISFINEGITDFSNKKGA